MIKAGRPVLGGMLQVVKVGSRSEAGEGEEALVEGLVFIRATFRHVFCGNQELIQERRNQWYFKMCKRHR